MATSALTTVFQYSDGETYSLTFSPYNPTSLSVTGFKQRVIDFVDSDVSTVSDTFISTAGAPLTGVKSAQIVTTDDRYFYQRG